MLVAVMRIGEMWMRMLQRLVWMRMRMFTSKCCGVRVHMVTVQRGVGVFMLMTDARVLMQMNMVFTQVQPDPEAHQ